MKSDTTNPKERFGEEKTPLHLIPPIALEEWAWAQKSGAAKYGAFNWRDTPVRANVYTAAMMRHLIQYMSGIDRDAESGCHHLAHVMANCAILMDAGRSCTLIDDRFKDKTTNGGDA